MAKPTPPESSKEGIFEKIKTKTMKEFIQIETTFFGSPIKMKFHKEDLKVDYYNHLYYLHDREKSAISMRQFIKMKTAGFVYKNLSENRKGWYF